MLHPKVAVSDNCSIGSDAIFYCHAFVLYCERVCVCNLGFLSARVGLIRPFHFRSSVEEVVVVGKLR